MPRRCRRDARPLQSAETNRRTRAEFFRVSEAECQTDIVTTRGFERETSHLACQTLLSIPLKLLQRYKKIMILVSSLLDEETSWSENQRAFHARKRLVNWRLSSPRMRWRGYRRDREVCWADVWQRACDFP